MRELERLPNYSVRELKEIRQMYTHDELETAIEKVMAIVSKYFNISVNDLIGNNRCNVFTKPRFTAIYFLRTKLGVQLEEVARRLNKNHSTLYNSMDVVDAMFTMELDYNRSFKEIEQLINQVIKTEEYA